jgi:hypothetical protein
LRKLILITAVCAFFVLASSVHAQQFDVEFGGGAVKGTNSSITPTTFLQTVGGGTYLAFRGDALIRHHFGVGGEIAWRAHQNLYGGAQPFRPLFFDVGAVYAPPLGKYAAVDLMAGIGAESVRFYTSQFICSFTGCTNYTSSNHFLGHFGGGLRLYPRGGGFFIEPEAHVYAIRNNIEFSGNHAVRVGVSIGYSFRSEY